jgi:hypothetical protein
VQSHVSSLSPWPALLQQQALQELLLLVGAGAGWGQDHASARQAQQHGEALHARQALPLRPQQQQLPSAQAHAAGCSKSCWSCWPSSLLAWRSVAQAAPVSSAPLSKTAHKQQRLMHTSQHSCQLQ